MRRWRWSLRNVLSKVKGGYGNRFKQPHPLVLCFQAQIRGIHPIYFPAPKVPQSSIPTHDGLSPLTLCIFRGFGDFMHLGKTRFGFICQKQSRMIPTISVNGSLSVRPSAMSRVPLLHSHLGQVDDMPWPRPGSIPILPKRYPFLHG